MQRFIVLEKLEREMIASCHRQRKLLNVFLKVTSVSEPNYMSQTKEKKTFSRQHQSQKCFFAKLTLMLLIYSYLISIKQLKYQRNQHLLQVSINYSFVIVQMFANSYSRTYFLQYFSFITAHQNPATKINTKFEVLLQPQYKRQQQNLFFIFNQGSLY